MTRFPCKTCKMSPKNSVHKNKQQYGYHEWVETPEEEVDRANDPAIQDILRHMREVNIQNPEYTEIKRILEEGVDGRYTDSPQKELPCGCMSPARHRGEMCPSHRRASGV